MKRYRLFVLGPMVALALTVIGCQDTPTTPMGVVAPEFALVQNDIGTALQATMAEVNAALDAQGAGYRVAIADYQSADPSFLGGTVVSRDVGNKSMDARFAANDPVRYFYPESDISWTLDKWELPPGMDWDGAYAPVAAAMNTWQAVPCVNIPLTFNDTYAFDWGVVEYFASGGASGFPVWLYEYTHAGWLDDVFVDMVGPDHAGVIGVTWTFVWVDEGDVPTDIDGNGYLDVAFRETYYNAHDFEWGVDPEDPSIIDIESIVLHEAGHGLSQGHFGNIVFIVTPKGVLIKRAPEAVMNPFYFGTQHDLFGTDVAGHCSIWGSWPND